MLMTTTLVGKRERFTVEVYEHEYLDSILKVTVETNRGATDTLVFPLADISDLIGILDHSRRRLIVEGKEAEQEEVS